MHLNYKTLRFRTAAAISVVFGLLSLSIYFVFNTIVIDGFLNLEDEAIRRNATRVFEGVHFLENEIALKAEEWGTWDDSYEYLRKPNRNYDTSNLTFDALDQLHVKHFFLMKLDGESVRSLQLNQKMGSLEEPPLVVEKQLRQVARLALEKAGPVAGLLQTPDSVVVVGAAPVSNSAGDAPYRGAILFSRVFDSEATQRLRELARTPLAIRPFKTSGLSPDLQKAVSEALLTKEIVTFTTDNQSIGVDMLKDIFGAPILAVSVHQKRDILAKGIQARNLVTIYILIFTFVAIAMALIFLNHSILIPLQKIREQSAQIGASQDDDLRVNLVGDFEIRHLASEINRMLDKLAYSKHEALEAINARLTAESASKAKSNFIARVSHELRTPIHHILGLIRVIRKKVTDDTGRSQMGMIRDAATGLLSVVNDILDFSKSEVGELIVRAEPTNLRTAIRCALRTAALRLFERAEGQTITCFANVDPHLPEEVISDSYRISQIITNLIGNAIKFTHSGNVILKVQQTTTQNLKTLVLRVEDTGIGISREKIEEIFKPFVQGDDSIQRKFSGTGLGLTVVDQLVQAMGGTITVDSEISKGSTFTVNLPLVTAGTEVKKNSQNLVGKRAWILNESLIEGEEISKAFQSAGSEVLLQTTETLKEVNIDTLGTDSSNTVLVVASNTLINHRTWNLIVRMIQMHGSQSVVVAISPYEITYREQLRAIGVTQLSLTPLLIQDLPAIVSGEYKESFAGYDDFADEVSPSSKLLNILVADDLPANRILLKAMLREAGHAVTLVANGEQLLEAIGYTIGIREKRDGDKIFDLVLTDIQMPVMDGITAIRILRDNESRFMRIGRNRLPVFAITTTQQHENSGEIVPPGADGVITKPIKPTTLRNVVEEVLSANMRSST